MATFEEHCKETIEKLGKPYEEVHRYLDEFHEVMGPDHRSVRHHIGGVEACIAKWGYEAGAAACIHIERDEHSHVKEGKLWVPKPTMKGKQNEQTNT